VIKVTKKSNKEPKNKYFGILTGVALVLALPSLSFYFTSFLGVFIALAIILNGVYYLIKSDNSLVKYVGFTAIALFALSFGQTFAEGSFGELSCGSYMPDYDESVPEELKVIGPVRTLCSPTQDFSRMTFSVLYNSFANLFDITKLLLSVALVVVFVVAVNYYNNNFKR
jgi:hypothetical protein